MRAIDAMRHHKVHYEVLYYERTHARLLLYLHRGLKLYISLEKMTR